MWKYLIYWVAFHALGRLPVAVLYRMAGLVAAAAYLLAHAARNNVRDNLRHVMPADTPQSVMRRAARQVFRTVVLYYADLARLPHLDVNTLFHHEMVIEGLYEHLLPAVQSGKGVVMLSAHFGNPELAGQGLIPCGVRMFALTEPVEPRLQRLMDGIRSSQGHEFGPVSVGNVKKVIKTLRSGGVVALMGDRDIQGPRERLPFLGQETLMPTGPIEVALRTGATVIPSFSARRGRRLYACMEPPLELEQTGDMARDVKRGELLFLERFEKRLRAEPGQWAVLEKVWDDQSTPATRDSRRQSSSEAGRG
jgi:KDO2-lipid IV(A) lauroyltransferase